MADQVEGVTISIRADATGFLRAMQRITWKVELHWARLAAQRAEWHADWYCSLSPAKRWLAMVLGL